MQSDVLDRPYIRPKSQVQSRPAVGRASAAESASIWGRLPVLSVFAALSLVMIALSDYATSMGADSGYATFWIGVILLFAPLALRACAASASRLERISLVVLLGLSCFMIKVLHSPNDFIFTDEFAHWRTASDIARTGHLFNENPLLPISALYPGLEIVTTTLAALSGLPMHSAALFVIGGARLLLTLSLFLLFEQVSGSARTAALASVLYMANPNYVFWSAQFAYESLSLPLAVFIINLAVRRTGLDAAQRWSALLLLVLSITALVATHHLTTYLLIALFAAWWLMTLLVGAYRGRPFLPAPIFLLPVTVAAVLAWVMWFAPLTVFYLVPVLVGAAGEFFQLLTGARGVKQFFRGNPAVVAPLWEQLTAALAVIILVGAVLVALALLWRAHRQWPRYRTNALALLLGIAALAYPATLALRLTSRGTETSNRSSEFLFVAIAFVLALACINLLLAQRSQVWLAPVIAFALLIFGGGLIIGLARWARMPGPYLVGGDTRAVQPESVFAAAWSGQVLGPGNGIIADHTNELLMGSLGGQRTIHGDSWVYFRPSLGPAEVNSLERSGVSYIITDNRLTTMLPTTGNYFERGEPDAGAHTEPLQLDQLTKFDRPSLTRRVFDSGHIVIFSIIPTQ